MAAPNLPGVSTEVALEQWKLVLIGLIGGFLGGGLGLGGGFIMVPLMVALGFGRHRAHATSLAAIVLIAAAGGLTFGLGGQVDLRLGLIIGIGGIIGGALGASAMHGASVRALAAVFIVGLTVASVRMIIGATPSPSATDLTGVTEIGAALLTGGLAGFLAGLIGIGGGMVVVPATVFFMGLTQHEAQGTSLVAMIFTAISGTLISLRNRRLILREGLVIGAGGVAGSVMGSSVALAIASRTLSVIFGVALLAIAARTAYTSFGLRSQRS
jgi:uncharacterized protein